MSTDSAKNLSITLCIFQLCSLIVPWERVLSPIGVLGIILTLLSLFFIRERNRGFIIFFCLLAILSVGYFYYLAMSPEIAEYDLYNFVMPFEAVADRGTGLQIGAAMFVLFSTAQIFVQMGNQNSALETEEPPREFHQLEHGNVPHQRKFTPSENTTESFCEICGATLTEALTVTSQSGIMMCVACTKKN